MGFRKCGHDDPFTRRVRELYRANVVGAPRAGIDPLDVLAVRKRHVEPRGGLGAFIDGGESVALPASTCEPTAGLNGLRSASVDIELGVTLTSAFLAALGLPIPGAHLQSTLWKGATSLDFEVRDVQEKRVDVGALGRALTGRRVDRRSPASRVFFGDDGVRMLIITRTLTSAHFALRTSAAGGQSIDISVDAITNLIGAADANVAWNHESSDTVSFTGPNAVTFAFAAVPCVIQPDATFLFGLESDDVRFGPGEQTKIAAKPIVDEDGLLEFDFA